MRILLLFVILGYPFITNAQTDTISFKSRNSVNLNLGVNSTQNLLFLDGDNDYSINERKAVDRSRLQLSYGATYQRRVKKKFIIETGLNFLNLGHKTIKQNVYFAGAEDEFDIPETMYILTETLDPYFDRELGFVQLPAFSDYRYLVSYEGPFNENKEVQKRFKYSYLEIPLNLSYSILGSQNKSEFLITGGFNFAFMINYQRQTFIDGEEYFTSNSSFRDILNWDRSIHSKPYNYGVNLGATYQRFLDNSWCLKTTINSRVFFNDFYNDYAENTYDNIIELQNSIGVVFSVGKEF